MTVLESASIIEHLQAHCPGPVRLIPDDAAAAVEVRMMDRVFDNYVSTPQGRIVFNSMRAEADRDPLGDAEARKMLETTYAWLDQRLAGREWATDHGFSLADCAAAPALFYADWTHPIPERFETLKAYRARLHDATLQTWGPDYPDPNTNSSTFAENPDNSDEAGNTGYLAWRNAYEPGEMDAMSKAAGPWTRPGYAVRWPSVMRGWRRCA